MKRLVVVVAIVAAGCSAQKPPSEPAVKKGEPIVLATFTGEADPATGKLDIRTVPTAAGRALGMTAAFQEVNAGVTVANDPAGPVWTCPSDGTGAGCASKPTGCPNGSAGRKVQITLNEAQYPSAGPDYLTAVYAELTSMTPATGNEPCNTETNPFYTNVSGLGLWSYGPIGGASPRTATADWGFLWNTGQGFSFAGKVIGLASKSFPTTLQPYVNATTGDVGRLVPGVPTAISSSGTEVFYAGGEPSTIVVVASDGATSTVTLDLPESVNFTSLAVITDGGSPYVWFTTTPGVFVSYVGVINWATKVVDALGTIDSADLRSLVVSPNVSRRAWFLSGPAGSWSAFSADWTPHSGVAVGARSFTFPAVSDVPEMLAFAPYLGSPTSFLFVTSSGVGFGLGGHGGVFVFEADGEPATYMDPVNYYDIFGNCSAPVEIVASPTGVLWVSGRETTNVCRIDPATGTETDITATGPFVSAPLALTVDTTASARVWANVAGGGVYEIDPADASVTQYYTLYTNPSDGDLVGATSLGGTLTFIPFHNVATLGNIRLTP